MKIKSVIQKLEQWAPPAYQESYDNAGLIYGNMENEVTGVLVCLDSVEETIEEALKTNSNLIIAHHPIVFKELKQITGKNYVERTLIKAIQNDIAIYAMHTNLDSVMTGVNKKIGDLIGVSSSRILSPSKATLNKLITYCPTEHAESLRNALFQAGGGSIGNYNSCSFNSEGIGTFQPLEGSNAFVGETNQLHQEAETRIELVFARHHKSNIIQALHNSHPYEEVAYEILSMENADKYIGAGMIGELEEEIDLLEFFDLLKNKFNLKVIRHTAPIKAKIKQVAWCGGAGSFLLGAAKAAKADIFITGDFKYHEFFDHENQLVIADIGHYESEQFTQHLIVDFLKENFDKFAVHLSGVNTNPVNYY